jgi:uncharacterized repeat protein (TIGR03803 family)
MCRSKLKSTLYCASAAALVMLGATQHADASRYSTLYTFHGSPDASAPGCLIRDAQGTLFGTSGTGGHRNKGTLFKLASDGTETILYSFTNDPPIDAFAMDSDGNFFGASIGGAKLNNGVIFEISSLGTQTILHKFTGKLDGATPLGGVTRDANGNLFGTTFNGGKSGFGTVFEIDAHNKFSTLHAFSDSDGRDPSGGVTLDDKGNIYGVADGGGQFDHGVLYKLDAGGGFTILHSFTAQDGYPVGRVVFNSQGDIFGTAVQGGDFGVGSLFEIDASGNFKTIHSFENSQNDGISPNGSLVVEPNGILFGVTQQGGEFGGGVIYKLIPRGKFSLLHSFGGEDGITPASCLVSDNMGHLFGATTAGATYNAGTLYRAQE